MKNWEQRLEIVINLADVGVWEFDPNEPTLILSNRMKSLFGLKPEEEVTYDQFLQIVHPEDRERIHRTVQTALSNRLGEYDAQYRVIGKNDGVQRILRAKARIEFNDESGSFRMIGASQDITAQKNTENALRSALEQANVANEAKMQFLANMSHEMRTPLGVMLGFADLASDPIQSPEDREGALKTIKRNGEQLLKLINEVLDLSRVDANQVKVEKVPIHFPDFINEIISTFRLKAEDKGIRLKLHSSSGIPEHIETDPIRLRQILVNVIGNAIKFTERGGVDISIETIASPDKSKYHQLRFTIEDTGIGMTAEQQNRLFQRFSQADETMTRRYGGSGLGLAISRSLAKTFGGDLTLMRSRLGGGSAFILTLPESVDPKEMDLTRIECPVEVAASLKQEAKSLPDLRGIRILLAEDARDNQVLVSRYLKLAGATVDIAENGKEAIEKAEQSSYDVVLMDLQMPVLNGYDATEALREHGYKKPIIALTAHALQDDKQRCLRVGFDDHMTKPVNKQALLEEVAEFAERG